MRRMGCLLMFAISVFSTIPISYGSTVIRCSTDEVFKRNVIDNSNLIIDKQELETEIQHWIAQNSNKRTEGVEAIVTIPVVVHVVYNTSVQNISDAQIYSQISRLNKDFRNLNTDKLSSSHLFSSLASDAGIEFCLAGVDPDGNATNGITRTYTIHQDFTNNDDVKYSTIGGADAWDATKYLNVWVCNLKDDLLGFATFPSTLSVNPTSDGIVIGYKYFGATGVVQLPYDQGRTATHEIGHWLGLEHIWGDLNDCSGTDHVADTPNQEMESTGCPNGIKTDNCTKVSPGVNYQNYMDYTDDACMVMFTKGQISRMKAVLNTARTTIGVANLCSGTTGVITSISNTLKVYPNPVQNYLTIEGLPKTQSKFYTVFIYNMIGEKVYQTIINPETILLEMADFKTGTYLMHIFNDEFSITHKLTVVK